MTDKTRIYVVDDEPDIRQMLDEFLTGHGYDVETCADGGAFRKKIEQSPPDLVLLDINMPGEDGLSIARFLREHHATAIIMLTAAGTVVDRIVGLEMGADDYVPKPFDPRELLARVKSVLRRSKAGAEIESETDGAETVRFGRCTLDLESHRLFGEEGENIPITAMEFDLLKAFATHPNRVLTRDQLLDMAHHRQWDPFDRSIDIRVARLRRKIEQDPRHPTIIKTVRGAGYIFVAN